MGADVIKIEPLRGDDARGWGPPFLNGEAAWFLSVNRNKRSMCLDIRGRGGARRLFQLLETADVFIENLVPAKLEKHGLGLDGLRERFPQLVICAFSGFGLDGPDAVAPRLRPHRPGPVRAHERDRRRRRPAARQHRALGRRRRHGGSLRDRCGPRASAADRAGGDRRRGAPGGRPRPHVAAHRQLPCRRPRAAARARVPTRSSRSTSRCGRRTGPSSWPWATTTTGSGPARRWGSTTWQSGRS